MITYTLFLFNDKNKLDYFVSGDGKNSPLKNIIEYVRDERTNEYGIIVKTNGDKNLEYQKIYDQQNNYVGSLIEFSTLEDIQKHLETRLIFGIN